MRSRRSLVTCTKGRKGEDLTWHRQAGALEDHCRQQDFVLIGNSQGDFRLITFRQEGKAAEQVKTGHWERECNKSAYWVIFSSAHCDRAMNHQTSSQHSRTVGLFFPSQHVLRTISSLTLFWVTCLGEKKEKKNRKLDSARKAKPTLSLQILMILF